ncbi:hypothetical protein B0O44_109174 [Pedobacter nutrimenti]|uniref:Uncharacterized protein n=1 Tax=Pedobacter nutrimenti TaxID=1241337 RepID=A0A318UF27_9SPHI|nr:hypothetical protein B0O44_109174 [Pedobacter nutrimenti]
MGPWKDISWAFSDLAIVHHKIPDLLTEQNRVFSEFLTFTSLYARISH